MKHQTISALSAVVLCLGVAGAAIADQAAFRSAETVREIRALGAQQMAGQSIQQVLSGRTFDNPDWTWRVRANGTHASAAKDGSWTDEGTWSVVGNQYCRSSGATEGRTICSDVYFLGRDLRFSQDANPRRLLNWFVSY